MDILTIKGRAETAYRAVLKLAEMNEEFKDHVNGRLTGVTDTLRLAGYAEETAKKRYATAVQDAEELLQICYHNFDMTPDTMVDPDIHAAVTTMLHAANPWDEIEAVSRQEA